MLRPEPAARRCHQGHSSTKTWQGWCVWPGRKAMAYRMKASFTWISHPRCRTSSCTQVDQAKKTPIFCLNWLFEILPANSTRGNRNLTKSSSFFTHPYVPLGCGQQARPTKATNPHTSLLRFLPEKPRAQTKAHQPPWSSLIYSMLPPACPLNVGNN